MHNQFSQNYAWFQGDSFVWFDFGSFVRFFSSHFSLMKIFLFSLIKATSGLHHTTPSDNTLIVRHMWVTLDIKLQNCRNDESNPLIFLFFLNFNICIFNTCSIHSWINLKLVKIWFHSSIVIIDTLILIFQSHRMTTNLKYFQLKTFQLIIIESFELCAPNWMKETHARARALTKITY